MGSIWGALITKLGDGIGSYFAAREVTKQKKLELDSAIHQRQIELISQGLAADASWELAQIDSNKGWRDSFILVILSIPLIGCFIPGLAKYILTGFDILGKCPTWYLFMIQAIFFAAWGIRLWRRSQSDT